jgi:hypothetical protein
MLNLFQHPKRSRAAVGRSGIECAIARAGRPWDLSREATKVQ